MLRAFSLDSGRRGRFVAHLVGTFSAPRRIRRGHGVALFNVSRVVCKLMSELMG